MKLTIDLTDKEVKGIKQYLKEVGEIDKPTKQDVQRYIQGVISGAIEAPKECVSDYIKNA